MNHPDTLVLYQSKYGSTKQYAEWLAESLGADLTAQKDASPSLLEPYPILVFGGWIIAGTVAGADFLRKNQPALRGKQVFLFAVGASDAGPEDLDALWKKTELDYPGFYLQGVLDYPAMSFPDKLMLRMMKAVILKKDVSERAPWESRLVEHFSERNDFMNRERLAPLIQAVRAARHS